MKTLEALAAASLFVGALTVHAQAPWPDAPQVLANGQKITPLAAPDSTIQHLNPGLAAYPDYEISQIMSATASPDGKTLLVLSSGYNDFYDSKGYNALISSEFVFVFDINSRIAKQLQALPVQNTFGGIAFAPDGKHFYVGGGVNDNVHVFAKSGGLWAEAASSPIALNHVGSGAAVGSATGLGIEQSAAATGLAVSADGQYVVVTDHYNDSISVVDVSTNTKVGELDLRPGKNGEVPGTPGGESPWAVAIAGNSTAYVSSERDREIDVVNIKDPARPTIRARIIVPGNPNKMVLSRDQSTLYVAMDNADAVAVIDTARNLLTATVPTVAPPGQLPVYDTEAKFYRGSAPNGLAISPDGSTLYVTNGGANSVAVIALDRRRIGDAADGDGQGQQHIPAVIGLIPTGWYPQDVAVGVGGKTLYVINSRGIPGPNPGNCLGYEYPCIPQVPPADITWVSNEYILELEKGGLQTVPVPQADVLWQLTRQVSENNGYGFKPSEADRQTMAALKSHIKHIIYVVRENRTYDQILGALPVGNGDPTLAEFASFTPNAQALATQFVDFDNFYDPAEVSGDGWPWSMSGRETDIGVKTIPIDYAYPSRGGSYDVEGTNRNINVGIGNPSLRAAADPLQSDELAAALGTTLNDPDLLPGTNNDSAPDGPDGEAQQGYLWNAAIRAGVSVRNYGYFCDLTRYSASVKPVGIYVPLDTNPYVDGVQQAYPADPALQTITDLYFRGFDNNYPDYYREQEWQREFNQFVANGNLPALSLVRLMHDHTSGNVSEAPYPSAIAGVNTPETQVADNDYATGLLLQAVANSPYANDTLVFIIEDDAQDGADHVDAHRSVAFVAGPYVKNGAVINTHYSTVNVLRTIEDVLGLDHLSAYTASQGPMTNAFDLSKTSWTYKAIFPAVLESTSLPQPGASVARAGDRSKPLHDARWWARQTKGMDFSAPDKVNAVAYNRILWKGVMGNKPYPTARSGKDLSQNRDALLGKSDPPAQSVSGGGAGMR